MFPTVTISSDPPPSWKSGPQSRAHDAIRRSARRRVAVGGMHYDG